MVRGLEKSYGAQQVLRGVDFDVRRGEVLCLLGPNGAGKTTTVEILEGFRDRTGGTVTVLGLDPAAQSTTPAIRRPPSAPSGAYLVGHIASTVTTTLAITACTALGGWLAFGTAPRLSGLVVLAGGLALGIICFAALGLAVSSLIKSAESAGPIANASYLPIAIVSGIFDPTMGVPHWLSHAASALPVKALAQVLADAYAPAVHSFPAWDLVILMAWAAAGAGFAACRFRWQP